MNPPGPPPQPDSLADLTASCRIPLFILFLSAAIWALAASAFGLIASIKFHSPNFLADPAWLTYGRVHPAATDSLLYGFCIQGGLGVALWLLARLGRTKLPQPGMLAVGALFWNLGLTIGIAGILAGDSTGFDYLEMPTYSVLVLALGYLVIGAWAALAFHQRTERTLSAAQWFVFPALFWFPWIFSTAELLLLAFPVRGVAQAVIAWWYADNLLVAWFGLVGLAAVFFFVPKLCNRQLHSRYLALFAFWMLLLCGGWGGIPISAPVPAWMTTLSTVTTVLMLIPVLSVALNAWFTARGASPGPEANPSLKFILVGVMAFVIAAFMRILAALPEVNPFLHFTWFSVAAQQLNSYGFLGMVIFGAAYRILPQLTGTEFPAPRLVRAHFWVALFGLLFFILPLAIGGALEAIRLQNPTGAFTYIVARTLPFLRISTLGDLLIALGNLLFLVNLAGLVASFSRARATAALAAATAELSVAEAKA